MSVGQLLFHYPVLNVGGAQLSSLRMMSALADRGWRITLVLDRGGGALEPMIDPRIEVVRLRKLGNTSKGAPSSKAPAFAQRIVGGLRLSAARIALRLKMTRLSFRRFDAAIHLQMHSLSSLLARHKRASVRVIWIRSDLAHVDPTGRVTAALRSAAPTIDHYVCVSQTAYDSFSSALPEASAKAEVIYNILNPERMRLASRQADPFPPRAPGELRILTVSRLDDRSKGLFRMVRVASRLVAAGHSFCWYVIGDGADRQALEGAIKLAGIENHMILIGEVLNPFPAYAAADIVAMLSCFEGLSGVVNEARVLERPIIATLVAGISEQLVDGVNALVVPQCEDAITIGLERLLLDRALRLQLASGGFPAAILDDNAKITRLEAMFRGFPATSL